MVQSWQEALAGRRMLVSGFGKWGGGVYDLTGGSPVALDDLATSGLTLGGGRLWRLLRAPGELTASCELLSYDERGIRSYQRLDPIRDPHDVCWHEGAVHISSSWDSVVWRLGPTGDAEPEVAWRGDSTVPDSWHVNSLVVVDGALHVSTFGRFDTYKGWKAEDAPAADGADGASAAAAVGAGAGAGGAEGQPDHREGSPSRSAGFIHDTQRGVDVLQGLGHPHNPQYHQGRWYVCESTRGSLTECDDHGRVLRRATIKRFSRGLGIVGGWALVGGNAHRRNEDDRGEIAVVDLDSFEVVDRIAMPCLEVYDIVPVPTELARGVAIGFGANPSRAVDQHRSAGRVVERQPTPPEAQVQMTGPRVAAKLARAGQVLDKERSAQLRISTELSGTLAPGESRLLPVVVENRSDLALATVAPHPIRVGARWMALDPPPSPEGGPEDQPGDHDGGGWFRNPFAPLPRLVHPGEQVELVVVLEAPEQPGRYEVRVAFHQPDLGWFGRRAQGEIIVLGGETTA